MDPGLKIAGVTGQGVIASSWFRLRGNPKFFTLSNLLFSFLRLRKKRDCFVVLLFAQKGRKRAEKKRKKLPSLCSTALAVEEILPLVKNERSVVKFSGKPHYERRVFSERRA